MLPCIYEPLQLVYPDEVPGRYLVSYGVFIVFGSTSELSGGCHWKIVCTRPAKSLTVFLRSSIFNQHPASCNPIEYRAFKDPLVLCSIVASYPAN
jgi:hypothetical protein